jgi:hypothetical protein
MTATATRPAPSIVTVRPCASRNCHEPAEHTHLDVPLCMVHWLRVRVSQNLR